MHPSKRTPKYVFVTGGVISGLGKGITTASTALLLKSAGVNVTTLKVDMYLNLDAGTINPYEHGEVFVTDDGIESDQDLGNYERFLNQDVHRYNYMTMGQIYYDVITKEREFEYAGQDIEGHIHIPNEILKRLKETARKDNADVIFVEVGGTVGEYQNVMFFEAMRRLKQKNPQDVFIIHVVYLPLPPHLGELKSKPAQSSVYELYKLGLQPDFIICRSDKKIDNKKKNLIAFNVGIEKEAVIAAPNVDTVYRIPLLYHEQGLDDMLLEKMGIERTKSKDLVAWEKMVENTKISDKKVKIAIVGKYFNFGGSVLEDAYICVIEAIKHACWKQDLEPEIQWFDVERFEDKEDREKIENELADFSGIIVPQGWGSRGVEGKLLCAQYARENKIPYLGLCFGMQMAVIEYARNVCGLKNANSTEVKKTKYPVIHIMPNQKEYLAKKQYGGTIRLGGWPCKLKKGSLLHELYTKYGANELENDKVIERHRHRYEVNNDYKKILKKHGLIFSGTSPDGKLAEAVELDRADHPFYVGTQYHPEYISRPLRPHPIFIGFVTACSKHK